MPPFQRWAELPRDLLCCIGDSLDLKCYASARGACTAWRFALAPPSSSLLLVPDDASCCPSAASISTHRAFELKAIPSGAECVGSSNGWLALSVPIRSGQIMFSLFHPITATEVTMPPLIYHSRWLSKPKLVFAPNPARDDFAAAAICDVDRLAYVTAGARRWAILDPVPLARGDQLADVVYHEKKQGRVYCLTRYGDVHVLRLPERRRQEPVMVDDPSSLPPIPPSLSAPAQRRLAGWQTHQQCALGPDLNAPSKVEPLLSLPFDPATSFAQPYNAVSAFTSSKNLVFCEGNLYQIWRNASCTVTVQEAAVVV